MALIPLAGRSHVLGQLFDVLAPYRGKAGLQVCQFLVRQENILVTAIACLIRFILALVRLPLSAVKSSHR